MQNRLLRSYQTFSYFFLFVLVVIIIVFFHEVHILPWDLKCFCWLRLVKFWQGENTAKGNRTEASDMRSVGKDGHPPSCKL